MRPNGERDVCFSSDRHARYFELGVVYHIVSRTRGNLFLLRPDLEGTLRAIIVGVLANARDRFPTIANFATSQMSNHLHDLLAAMRGDPRLLADYIAYTKREIALRWRREVGWSGSVFEGYRCSALVTAEAQLSAFKYVLSQGVKENLVDDPRQWPGFHCAESLMTGEPMKGYWLNGTAFGKALHAEKVKRHPRVVRREDYLEPREFITTVSPVSARTGCLGSKANLST